MFYVVEVGGWIGKKWFKYEKLAIEFAKDSLKECEKLGIKNKIIVREDLYPHKEIILVLETV